MSEPSPHGAAPLAGRPRAVLFDVDGTLLSTQGAGTEAMVAAGRQLFGPGFRCASTSFAGRLDPWIWRSLCRENGIEGAEHHEARFRAAYGPLLRERLARAAARALPGVRELVQALRALAGVRVGLLTGNYPEGARLKLESAGLDPAWFDAGAFGDDGRERSDLVPVALARLAPSPPCPAPGDVVVVGDTPHDVACAHTHGCRALAVATGRFALDELRAAGAHLAVADLSAQGELVAWVLDGGG